MRPGTHRSQHTLCRVFTSKHQSRRLSELLRGEESEFLGVLQQPGRGDISAQLRIVHFLVFPSGLILMVSSCRRLGSKGFTFHPEIRLLRNDNEMQCVASCLTTTKLEDPLAKFIERYFVLIFRNIALCGVRGTGC